MLYIYVLLCLNPFHRFSTIIRPREKLHIKALSLCEKIQYRDRNEDWHEAQRANLSQGCHGEVMAIDILKCAPRMSPWTLKSQSTERYPRINKQTNKMGKCGWVGPLCIALLCYGRDSITSSSWRAEWQHRRAGRARAPAANNSKHQHASFITISHAGTANQRRAWGSAVTHADWQGAAPSCGGGSWRLAMAFERSVCSSESTLVVAKPDVAYRWHMNEAASRVCPVGERCQFVWKQSIELLFSTSCYLHCK